MSVIRTEDLTKRFGEFTAVDGVSFSVEPGEIFGFLWDKQFGFLKGTLVAPASRLQVMLRRTLGGAHGRHGAGDPRLPLATSAFTSRQN
jgi:hypothetical protein